MKKSFKSNVSGADRLFSANDTLNTSDIQGAQDTRNTSDIQGAQDTHNTTSNKSKNYYRFNLKLDLELKEYLTDAAWKSRISITEYLNYLVRADMSAHVDTES